MSVLSYKEFIDGVRARLGTFSNEDFQDLLSWASKEHPATPSLCVLASYRLRESAPF